VSGQSGDVWLKRRILTEFRILVEVVDIVANSEEFVAIVRACQKNTSDSHNFTLWNLAGVNGETLNDKYSNFTSRTN